MTESSIRKAIAADVAAIKNIADSSGIFPSEYLDDMIYDYLNNTGSGDIWFVYINQQQPIGFGYCVPEKLTDGTYNLLAIAVNKNAQGSGIGQKMLAYIEAELSAQGKRILIVDTSGSAEYALTRKFYQKAGYTLAATIKDFWKDGDDKITFYKRLQ